MKHIISSTFLFCTFMLGTACATPAIPTGDMNEPDKEAVDNKDDDSNISVDKTTGIEFFHGSMADAMAKAKKEGKHIFFDAYAVWCGPCRTMASRTFTKKEVADYFNENFVNVKMDMERGEGPSWSNRFKITAYPTLLILNDKGEIVGRTLGYQNGEQLISFGKKHVK